MQQATDQPADPRLIVMLVYPGVMAMDVFGPLEAFATANHAADQPHYRLEIAGMTAAPIATSQMQRQIQIPGLQQRTANGSTGANQFLAQVEIGYKLGVWDMASVTPFARFQTSSTTQNAFTESGANSLNLNVAQQTTNSLRTVLGAEFASSIPLGTERTLGLSLRLGWQHEYAYTGRPITASFGGAPSASFTVYGAAPTRDAAIVGFSAMTSVAAATQLYLRYDGELASGTDNHALTAGLRMSW